jgi:hypothetical protein
MSYSKFIEYGNKKILVIDIGSCKAEDFEALLAESGDMIRSEPPGSVLSLACGGNNTPIFTNREIFIQYLLKNEKYMKASAVSGLDKMKASMFTSIVSKSSRQIHMFATEAEALDWLILQK